MADVQFTGDPQEVAAKVAELGRYLSGELEDKSGAVREALTAVGLVTLHNIHDHFDRLSQGGTGDDGTVWQQLSAVTLALRLKDKGAKAIERLVADLTGKNGKVSASRRRMFLANAKKMRRLYTEGRKSSARRRALRLLEITKPYISETRYKSIKKELNSPESNIKRKALNRLVFASASALILRNNNDLFNSLEPYLGALGQVFIIGPGWVDVGTKKDYAKYHQSPEPRKLKKDGAPILPRRPFLPDIIPQFWYDDALEALAKILGSSQWMLKFLGGNT